MPTSAPGSGATRTTCGRPSGDDSNRGVRARACARLRDAGPRPKSRGSTQSCRSAVDCSCAPDEPPIVVAPAASSAEGLAEEGALPEVLPLVLGVLAE